MKQLLGLKNLVNSSVSIAAKDQIEYMYLMKKIKHQTPHQVQLLPLLETIKYRTELLAILQDTETERFKTIALSIS